ncbi:MlrC C-terminal domain-containing protein, partial [Klebsiella pneumoniae]|uniref:MlrC C-terminal domain-containing protein n=1 Tax=Klebsiella pneumoniae TaxID=573 RepID=UPI001954E78B
VVVIADGDEAKAAALAMRLGRELWDLREAITARMDTIDQGIDAALDGGKGPVVIADAADNPGGGAPADSTYLLRRLIERGVKGAV